MIIVCLSAALCPAPGKVENLVAIRVASKLYTVSWTPPEIRNGIIRGYQLGLEPKRLLHCTRSPPEHLMFNISGNQTARNVSLMPAAEYSIRVKAHTVADGQWATIRVTTSDEVPEAAPRDVNVPDVSDAGATVTWKEPDCALSHGAIKGYKLKLRMNAPQKGPDRAYNITVTSITFNGLSPFTNYSLELSAWNTAGDGPAVFAVFRTGPSVPNAPTNLTSHSASSTSIAISWLPPKPLTGTLQRYRVYYRTSEHAESTIDKIPAPAYCNATTRSGRQCFAIQDLTPNTRYHVFVTAKNELVDQWSKPSNEITVTTQSAAPGKVENLVAIRVASKLYTVSWTPPEIRNGIIRGYQLGLEPKRLLHCTRSPPEHLMFNISGNQTARNVSLMPAAEYSIRVKAHTVADGQWATIRVTTSDEVPEATPRDVNVPDVSDAGATVTWKEPDCALSHGAIKGYKLKLRMNAPQKGPDRAYNITVTSITFNGLSPFTNYSLELSAWNTAGDGPAVFAVFRTGPSVPNAPTNLTSHSASSTSIAISWLPPKPLTGTLQRYRVYYRTSEHAESTIDKIPAPAYCNATTRSGRQCFAIQDLTPNTRYHVFVTAKNELVDQWSKPSNEITVTTQSAAPGKVENLVAIRVASKLYTVSWTPPEIRNGIIRGYQLGLEPKRLLHCTRSPPEHLMFNISGNQTARNVSLMPAAEYSIRVKAHTVADGQWATIRVTTSDEVPEAAPRDVNVPDVSDAGATVTWKEPDCALSHGAIKGYKLKLRMNAPQKGPDRAYNITVTSITFNGLSPFTNYSLELSAWNTAGDGPAVFAVFRTGPSVPNAPTNLTSHSASSTSIAISWLPPKPLTGTLQRYRVYYRTSEHAESTIDKIPAPAYCNATTRSGRQCFAIQDLTPNTRYHVFVTAKNELVDQWSKPSNEITVTTQSAAPGKVENLVAIRVASKLYTVSWTPPEIRNGIIRGYQLGLEPKRLLHCTRSPPEHLMFNISGNQTARNVSLMPAAEYSIRVKAHTVADGQWATIRVTTSDEVPEAAPRDVNVPDVSDAGATVTWKEPDCALSHGAIKGYKLKLRMNAPQKGPDRAYNITVTSITFNGLSPFTNYSLELSAWNTAGDGPAVFAVFRTGPSVPNAPTNLTSHSASSTSIAISWLPPKPLTGTLQRYRVYYRTSEHAESTIDKIPAPAYCNATTRSGRQCFAIQDLTPNTRYHVFVTAKNELVDQWSKPSNEITVTTQSAAPGKVENLVAIRVASKLYTVSWTPPEIRNGIIRGYQLGLEPKRLLHCTRSPPEHLMFNISGNQTARNVSLMPAAEYSIRVKAHTVADGQWATIRVTTSDEVPEATPRDVNVPDVSDAGATVTWKEPDCALSHGAIKGYKLKLRMNAPQKGPDRAYNITVTSITFNGLSPFTNYSLELSAWNTAGDGPAVFAVFRTGPSVPNAPTNLTSHSASSTSIAISWLPPKPLTGTLQRYRVYYRTSEHAESTIDKIPAPAYCNATTRSGRQCFAIQDLTPNTRYHVFVTAKNELVDQWSKPSNEITVTTQSAAPGKVENLVAIRVASKLYTVSWTPPEIRNGIIRGYQLGLEPKRLLHCTRSPPEHLMFNISGNQTARNVSLMPAAEYSIRVKAHTVADGQWATIRVTTSDEVPEAAPRDVNVPDVSDAGATVTWKEPDCALSHGAIKGYKLKLRMNAPQKGPDRAYNITVTSITFNGLSPFTNYSLELSAWNTAGDGPAVFAVFRTGPSVPNAPTNLTSHSASSTSIAISWLPPKPLTGTLQRYRVYYRTSEHAESTIDKIPAPAYCNATTRSGRQCFAIQDLTPNTRYHVFVTAKNELVDQWSKPSNEITVTTQSAGEDRYHLSFYPFSAQDSLL
ncbi:phosphatidylinositol phosphatase PTPRQ-like [Ornithodoros turicata]|uniref:phosphatidylinositol phosphatase PTPRQ-like n=1 Tax=Ornithodoros turicata TaxID=34597 RepID=UPI0031387D79